MIANVGLHIAVEQFNVAVGSKKVIRVVLSIVYVVDANVPFAPNKFNVSFPLAELNTTGITPAGNVNPVLFIAVVNVDTKVVVV